MEDLKSQDTDLAKEMSKIKAMQGKLAKKLIGQEKDKQTGPKQETKFTKIFSYATFLVFIGLFLIVINVGYMRELQKSDKVIANLTKQNEMLLMERSKLEANLDSLNKTIAEEPQEFDSEPGNSWARETLGNIFLLF